MPKNSKLIAAAVRRVAAARAAATLRAALPVVTPAPAAAPAATSQSSTCRLAARRRFAPAWTLE
eukprot:5992149-Prymnesium_polylepis.1